jgi:hypothetical protein
VVAGHVVWWSLRGNTAQIHPRLNARYWTAVADGAHNSNTDLAFWKNQFYLVHASSPYHMGTSRSRILLYRSPDARNWELLHVFQADAEDVRDPKLAIIGGRLLLYVLKNRGFEPAPYATAAAYSTDGANWSPLADLEPRGWLLWRPKTNDGQTYYVTAYWHEHGRSALFRSPDGLRWEFVSQIYAGDRNDETDMEFLPDGRILAGARLEGNRAWHQGAADARTLLAVAAPPYTNWQRSESRVTRLDGPNFFRYAGRVFAVARFDPEMYDRWYGMSSLLGRKRTAIYEVTPEKLTRISDLHSAGDTSYAGVAIKDGSLYISYYTNDPERDYAWLLGLILPTDVRMARVDLDDLLAAADRPLQGGGSQ